ncbi:MAG TPA: abortive infection family protein [Puia sp.]|jgi:hypothetical protein|nr:abortive infection family protein [Puia sp.]
MEKLSEYTLSHLAKAVSGDTNYSPYMRGVDIILFFNKFGYNEVYGAGFPGRVKYTGDKLRELNGTDSIRKIIEEIVDPRRYININLNVENAIQELNEILRYDRLELVKAGDFFKLIDNSGQLIEPETIRGIKHEFINQQIGKCQKKIQEEDFNGAITNSRSLIEAIFIEIIERHEKENVKNDGDIENLWKKVKKIMKLEIQRDTFPEFVIQILSGIETSLKGLAGLSNNAGDRHANKFKTMKHHAKLAVNLAMTLADFLIDSWNYQQDKSKS